MILELILYFTTTLLLLIFLINLYISFANKKKIVDMPIPDRSIHTKITITSCGAVFTIVSLLSSNTYLFFFQDIKPLFLFLCIVLILLSTSLIDDLINLKPLKRLLIYLLTIFFTVFLIYEKQYLYSNISLFIILIFSCTWFLNLYNFMDNCDLNLSINFIAFSCSILIFHYLNIHIFDLQSLLTLSTFLVSVIIFSFYNFPPAKIFMGDSGSIILGFICIWFSLIIISDGNYYILIIFSSYIFDSTFTLCKRALLGKNIFKAHKEHLNQVYIINNSILSYLKKNLLMHLCLMILMITLAFNEISFIYSLTSTLILNITYFFFIINTNQ